MHNPAVKRLSRIETMLQLPFLDTSEEESFDHEDPFQNVPGLKRPTNAIEEMKEQIEFLKEGLI